MGTFALAGPRWLLINLKKKKETPANHITKQQGKIDSLVFIKIGNCLYEG